MGSELTRYSDLLTDIKLRIRQAQTKAVFSANTELILLYWDIGRMIESRQQSEGWGTAVIPRLSRDIHNDLPAMKGFSERNLKRMIRFYREYPVLVEKVPQTVAQLPEQAANEKGPQVVASVADLSVLKNLQKLVTKIPWGQNFLLIEKVKDLPRRLWYMQKTIENGWSRNVLQTMIKSNAHERQGKAVTNFEAHLPAPQSDLAQQALKDPYIFDFLTLDEPFRERELETGLVRHLEKFLLELGTGFSFVGRQYHLDVGNDDFYIDLLFYHLKLRCFVVIDLKVGPFKPGYAGKMNFYLNVVDDKLKHKTDNPSIGLILCQDKKKIQSASPNTN